MLKGMPLGVVREGSKYIMLTFPAGEIIRQPGITFFLAAECVEFFYWRKEICIMASSNQAARVPEDKPEIVEVSANVRPLPAPKAKEPKFVIKAMSSIPC